MTHLDDHAALTRFETAMRPHRGAFAALPAIRMLAGAAQDRDLLHLFLIHFCAFGVAMTRPVEGWIRAAGESCLDRGYRTLGEALIAHAAHEAGHHEMMIADLEALAARWNAAHDRRIDPAHLMASPPESTDRYRRLHESLVADGIPFAQIAVEYEIEALSVTHGAPLLDAAGALAGDGGTGLSFLRDAGHTAFNRRRIAALLQRHPQCLDTLVRAGADALDIYGGFLGDCLQAAFEFGARSDSTAACTLHAPPGTGSLSAPPEWLCWLRAVRSAVLHDGGRRPAFGPGGGQYGDPDPADAAAWHMVLRDGEAPVGGVRLTPKHERLDVVGNAFGRDAVRRALRSIGIDPAACAEASRLFLHPDYRDGHNARRLLAAVWALAAATGADAVVAAAGTAGHQYRLFASLGARAVPGIGTVRSDVFGDELRLVWFAVDPDAPPAHPEIAEMRDIVEREPGPRPLSDIAA